MLLYAKSHTHLSWWHPNNPAHNHCLGFPGKKHPEHTKIQPGSAIPASSALRGTSHSVSQVTLQDSIYFNFPDFKTSFANKPLLNLALEIQYKGTSEHQCLHVSATNSENTLKTFPSSPTSLLCPALAFHSPPGAGRHLENRTCSAKQKHSFGELKCLVSTPVKKKMTFQGFSGCMSATSGTPERFLSLHSAATILGRNPGKWGWWGEDTVSLGVPSRSGCKSFCGARCAASMSGGESRLLLDKKFLLLKEQELCNRTEFQFTKYIFYIHR